MTDEVVVQSSNSPGRLILSNPEYHPNCGLNYFVATLEDADLEASSRVYAYRADALLTLFRDLAANWRGWEGEKLGSTIEGDLLLTCTSDSLGHTFVKVRLISQMHNWNVEITLRLDVAQLDKIAKRLKAFLKAG
jgi:hypothetical protein